MTANYNDTSELVLIQRATEMAKTLLTNLASRTGRKITLNRVYWLDRYEMRFNFSVDKVKYLLRVDMKNINGISVNNQILTVYEFMDGTFIKNT